MSDSSQPHRTGRPRGRPKRADAPIIPWDEVDKLLVHGEVVVDKRTGRKETRFPSLLELGRRYGVSKNRIWQYASRNKTLERRKEAAAREKIRYDRVVAARRAEARALGTQDVVEVVDAFIEGFKQNVANGKVRFDSPADFDRLVRLKELLQGGADARTELQGGITLEAIQARHRAVRGQQAELTPELAGTADVAEEADDAASN